MIDALRTMVQDPRSPSGRKFDYGIQLLIVLSLVAFSIDTLPNLDTRTREMLDVFETVTIAIFLVEYLLRLFTSKKPLRFAFSFFGIIDFLAIAPYFLASGIDLRSLRAFRLLKLFLALKLLRYNRAIKHFGLAFEMIKEELLLFLFTSLLLIFVSSVGIYYFEKTAQPEAFASVFHSLWWAVITLTTVGFGDVYPITVGGRIFTFCILMVGLAIFAVPSGLLASALSEIRRTESERDQKRKS
jgi:voltage-gated potassium channel